MAAILIKIDRDTLKRNPDAGQTSGVIPGMISARVFTSKAIFESVGKTEVKQSGVSGQFLCTEASHSIGDERVAFAGETSFREFITGPDCRIELIREEIPWQTHAPIPTWSFRYVPTMIECCHCHAQLLHTELDSDDEGYEHEICPRCHEPKCCEIEYERMPD